MKRLPFLNQAYGQILRNRREIAGMTQQGLADATGCVRSYVQFLEGGKQTPTATVMVLIAEALGVEPDQMFREVIMRMRNLEEVAKIRTALSKGGLTWPYKGLLPAHP